MHAKDYELIAKAIGQADTCYDVALNLVQALKADNERFNPERFIKACGFHIHTCPGSE